MEGLLLATITLQPRCSWSVIQARKLIKDERFLPLHVKGGCETAGIEAETSARFSHQSIRRRWYTGDPPGTGNGDRLFRGERFQS